ncbi:ORC1-type DNA replication protein [Candidatus Woesearchaeota archaeon]|nr:ORC1-type DNA replication protein [Candidatus Woesearchaeota archaeon]
MMDLGKYFEDYITKESLFKNKTALQSTFIPKEIMHREEQVNQIAGILAPVLREECPSNLFVYGKTGTGKTVTIKHITEHINTTAKKRKKSVKIVYVNCKLKRIADTEYRLIAMISRSFGKEIPVTGLPTDEVYNIFYKAIDLKKQIVLIILDEIDQLVKKTGDEIIYNLTRINGELKNSKVAIIGISNDLVFSNNLDPRVKSSLSEEEIIFPPYNALQIQDILKERSEAAFKSGCLEEGLIQKCSAYAAREHGDARRALELLRVAAEIAERESETSVKIKHLDLAEEKIEKDRIVEIVKTQPKQFQLVLHSIFKLSSSNKTRNKCIFTGDIYELYKSKCPSTGLRSLTQRRVSDVIAELDMLGLINARVISKGRFGRTREVSLGIPESLQPQLMNLLEESLGL